MSTAEQELVRRKAAKLLAHGSKLLAQMTAESLCDEPQKFVIKDLLGDLRSLLDEFEEAFLDDTVASHR